MAGKIQFNIHPFYTNRIKSSFGFDYQNTAGEGVPGILIDIDSIVSIGSEVKETSIIYLTGNPEDPTSNSVRAKINDVILFLKDVPYNNIPGTTKVQNPYKFRLSVQNLITTWSEQWAQGQFKTPNGVDFPCKIGDLPNTSDAGVFNIINCINSKFDLLQATIEAIEANPGSGVTPVKVGVDIDTFRGLFPNPVTPTPFSFKSFPPVEPGGEGPGAGEGLEPGEGLPISSPTCLNELQTMIEKGIIEGPGAFLDLAHDAIESQNEEQACTVLEALKGAAFE